MVESSSSLACSHIQRERERERDDDGYQIKLLFNELRESSMNAKCFLNSTSIHEIKA
ncbi:hypothetical protein RHMOL_Rhmol08G0292400 [Rhododendron molle]|uniref:Uncharacterized protein n=1 Tax=Rhododendron molle TaxID=49168 RepID=A0ACC0MUS7_RHOML|nr:hypothetical protein RHMOL_Rhmol08G0292400 [Rhododendron molle]